MENLLNGVADGSVRGLARLFTLFHVAHCSHCGTYLQTLRDMVSALRGIKKVPMPDETLSRLQSKVREASASESDA